MQSCIILISLVIIICWFVYFFQISCIKYINHIQKGDMFYWIEQKATVVLIHNPWTGRNSRMKYKQFKIQYRVNEILQCIKISADKTENLRSTFSFSSVVFFQVDWENATRFDCPEVEGCFGCY